TLARYPGATAREFVTFAGIVPSPTATSDGNVIREPPPATALMVPAARPAASRPIASMRSIPTYHKVRLTSWPGGRVGGLAGPSLGSVRAPKDRVFVNGNPGRPAGQCHREQTAVSAMVEAVRVKRWGKSPPASRVTGVAR